jgi:aminoglycoside phosphotransferase (APT) family kinase protein
MEYVEGTVVDQMSVAESLTPHRRSEIGSSMARTLAMIHAVDVDKVGLSNLASRSPYALRQLKRWSGQLENSKTRDLPVLDELTRRLTEGAPKQLEVTLVHGDFHLRNVITSPANGEVDAVLDWELSTLGDPLADLGGLLAYWVEPGEESGVEFPATSLVGFPTRNQMIDAYVEISDRDPTYVPYWRALGLWKLAIIAQGVMLRATAVPSNKSAIGTPTNEQVDSFVRRALFAAEEAAI